jgi:hypothetical protein
MATEILVHARVSSPPVIGIPGTWISWFRVPGIPDRGVRHTQIAMMPYIAEFIDQDSSPFRLTISPEIDIINITRNVWSDCRFLSKKRRKNARTDADRRTICPKSVHALPAQPVEALHEPDSEF